MTAVETIQGFATNPGAGPVALTAGPGNTFTVRNTALGSKVWLDGMWYKGATAGYVRVRSPRLHDNVQGIKFQAIAASALNLMGDWPRTVLVPQDNLTVEIAGGGAETDVGCLQLVYDSLPGSDGQWSTWAAVLPRIVDLVTVEVNIAASANLGQWSAGTALNATNDLLKANTFYAWIGYVCAVNVGAIALQGPDLGGLRAGGPGSTNILETREWWKRQDATSDTGLIPVINSANKGGTLAFQVDASAGAANLTDFLFAELSPA